MSPALHHRSLLEEQADLLPMADYSHTSSSACFDAIGAEDDTTYDWCGPVNPHTDELYTSGSV